MNELIQIDSINVSLFIEFANVTDFDHLVVFIRHDLRPDLDTKVFDKFYVVSVNGKCCLVMLLFSCLVSSDRPLWYRIHCKISGKKM